MSLKTPDFSHLDALVVLTRSFIEQGLGRLMVLQAQIQDLQSPSETVSSESMALSSQTASTADPQATISAAGSTTKPRAEHTVLLHFTIGIPTPSSARALPVLRQLSQQFAQALLSALATLRCGHCRVRMELLDGGEVNSLMWETSKAGLIASKGLSPLSPPAIPPQFSGSGPGGRS